MRLRRHLQRHDESSHGIDLAPMLDFVMNLLIFFIITAVFVKEMGVTVNRAGGASAGGANAAVSVPVSIAADGEIWVDGRIVDLRAVRANVERLHAANPKGGVLIAADRHAATGLVVEVIDQIHLAGVYDITFGTREMKAHRTVHESDEHGIDLAPMLDFVLNLLIFFITTSFVKDPGMIVVQPRAETAVYRESGNILIAVRENGEIWMDRKQVDLRDVRALVERMHVERPEDTAVIVADVSAQAGVVAQVMDEVKLAGIKEIALGAEVPADG